MQSVKKRPLQHQEKHIQSVNRVAIVPGTEPNRIPMMVRIGLRCCSHFGSRFVSNPITTSRLVTYNRTVIIHFEVCLVGFQFHLLHNAVSYMRFIENEYASNLGALDVKETH